MKIMKCYKIKVDAIRPRFMEPDLKDTMEHYVVADSLDAARDYVYDYYMNGGWIIKGMTIDEATIVDIRK